MSIKMAQLILLLLAMSVSIPGYGQIRSSTISGTVKDSSEAILPSATVTITNELTGVTQSQVSNSSGQFVFPLLQEGQYTVSVNANGFTPYKQVGVRVAPSQSVHVEIELTVTSVQSQVEVLASSAQLQTETTSVSGALDAKAIDAVPNITQNPLYYAFLQAGVQPRNAAASSTNTQSFGIGVNGRRQFSAVGINGGRAFTNDIQLDGLPVMGGGYNEAAVIPNTEGLQEVRVISNNFSAEYGRGQGVISMSTKSGTNEFHGQGSYMLRNEALNANRNENKANGNRRTPFKVNEFGGTVSGPIIKNKLFFSSSYHHLRFNQGVVTLTTVPTALERIGDFSKTFIRDESGQPVAAQIFNPFQVTQLGPNLYQRAPYPNAIVTNPHPAALLMNSFYPLPNRAPDDVFNTNNFTITKVQTIRRHSLNNRVDFKWRNHSIYGSGGFGYGEVQTPRPFGESPFNGAPSRTRDRNPYLQIGDTIVLSPSLVLDFRYGATRINTLDFAGDKEGFTDYDKVGVPRNLQPFIQINGAAPVLNNFGGGNGGGSNWTALSGGNFGTKQEKQVSHVLSGSLVKIRGRWTHKFGGEYRNLLSNYLDLEEASVAMPSCCAHVGGNYTFEYVTADGAVAPQVTLNRQRGVNGAALFTGAGVWWIRPGANLAAAFGQPYYAVYSQNDWRASSKLTLNLGLRYEIQPGPTERYNRMSAYDLERANPLGAQGAMAFPGTNGYSRGLWDTSYNNWGPRLGAAYKLGDGMVIRGGFGITYLPSNTGYFSGPNDYGSSPFGSGTNMIPYGTSPQGVPVYRFSDPAPLALAVGANENAPQIYGVSEARFDRHLKNGMAKQWNLFIEKTIAKTWLVSAGYSASKTTNLSNRNQIYQNMQNVPAATLADWRARYIASNGTLNPANEQVPNPLQPASGPLLPFNGVIGGRTIPRYITYLPYPYLFGDGSRINDSRGFADYNALQLRLSHSFASGFLFDMNYTWSKELDYTATATEDGQGFNSGGSGGGPDILNLRNNRRYGSADAPHRFTAVAVYELPFGVGKMFNPSNRFVSSLVSGWQLSSVITAQAGMPFILNGASTGAVVGRPNRISGVALEVPKELQRWYDGATPVTLPCGRVVTPARNTFLKYNACAFEGQTIQAPNGSFIADQFWTGTTALNLGDMRGPGRFNIDMSLKRTFRFTEKVSMSLYADATNFLNNAQLSGNYNGALGNTNLTTNAARGLKPGMGTSDTFGTVGVGAFDPRQITFRLMLRF
jgi:trimeric autotransporter adhesin